MGYRLGQALKIVDTSGHSFRKGEIVTVVLEGEQLFDAVNEAGLIQCLRMANVVVVEEEDKKVKRDIEVTPEPEYAFEIGAVVRILPTAKKLQSDNWNSQMDGLLGRVGTVVGYHSYTGMLRVKVDGGTSWCYNPECLELVTIKLSEEGVKKMNTFKVGDIIEGTENDIYSITNQRMTKAEVTKVYDEDEIEIKVLEHENRYHVGSIYDVESEYFVPYTGKSVSTNPAPFEEKTTDFVVGDIITGNETTNKYGITNSDMYEGLVIKVEGRIMVAKVLKHRDKTEIGCEYPVEPIHFNLVRHATSDYPKIEYVDGIKRVWNPPYTIVETSLMGVKFVGKAKCMKSDEFDETIGLKYANERLLKEIVGVYRR